MQCSVCCLFKYHVFIDIYSTYMLMFHFCLCVHLPANQSLSDLNSLVSNKTLILSKIDEKNKNEVSRNH